MKRLSIFIALLLLGCQCIFGASITGVSYTSVVDTSPPTNNLSTVGTKDWAIWSANMVAGVAPTNAASGLYDHKLGGTAINMTAVVANGGATIENNGVNAKSIMAFTWTGGTINSSATAYNPADSDMTYANTNTIAYGQAYQTVTFVAGDTNSHVIHLYGYVANTVNGVTLQFTASLTNSTTSVTNITAVAGDFDYSLTYQADNINTATNTLTIVFTFQKTIH